MSSIEEPDMFWRKHREHDLDRELRSDLDLEAEELREQGLSPEQAANAARRALGNAAFIKEDVRRAWGWTAFEILLQDFHYALRNLLKSPGFTTTAFLTLALGIGASTAVFTLVNSILLTPLSYPDAARLVVAWERPRSLGGGPTGANPKHVAVWQQRATAFSDTAYLRHTAMNLTLGAEHPRLTGAVQCSPNLFDLLRVRPLLGRTFTPEEAVKGKDAVVILAYSLWQTQFQSDPAIIGRTIRVDDIPRTVIGVLPAGFHFPNGNALRATRSRQPLSGAYQPVIFVPAAVDISLFAWNGNYGNWIALARLNPGITVRRADSQLNTIQAQITHDHLPDKRPGGLLATVEPMRDAVTGESSTALWLLLCAVIGLMLIACLNLANAQFGRALARRRDAAVRMALGAAKWRLVWSALSENLLLATFGGAAGVLLAAAGLTLLRRYSPVDLPRLAEVHLDPTVLLFAVLLTFTASLLSGVIPALRLLLQDPQTFLQHGTNRALGSRHASRLRPLLIGLQVSGCTALLLITGLFSKSLLRLLHQERGFETQRVVMAEAGLAAQTYNGDQSRIAFDDGVLQNLRSLPGVQHAGLVSAMPLEGESWVESAGRPDRPHDETPLINLRWVSPGYFEATGQRLVAGRFFEERDRSLDSTVLSESEAKALWGAENPIGGQVRIRGRARTVIGVVADSRNTSLKTPAAHMGYLHYKDRPPYTSFFAVRSALSPETLATAIRKAIWTYAPDVAIPRIKTLDSQLTDSLAPERFQTLILTAFGAAALLLAMLGIYGVLNYSVVSRKQEIGVRMALGATRGSVYSLTFGEAGLPVVVGLVAGLMVSLFAGRLIQKLLYGIQVVDLTVIFAVTALFLLAAGAAAFLPARRAASVDPMEALRSE
jgi:predicted permease